MDKVDEIYARVGRRVEEEKRQLAEARRHNLHWFQVVCIVGFLAVWMLASVFAGDGMVVLHVFAAALLLRFMLADANSRF